MHLRGDMFTLEQKRRNFAYYESLTVRDSSLGACTNAVLASELGHLRLAQDYLDEAALMDLHDLEHNTADGLHLASLAGGWIAAICGLAGLRDRDGQLQFAPRLPAPLSRLAFSLSYQRRLLHVEVKPEATRYTLRRGQPLDVTHHREPLTIKAATTVVRVNPPAPLTTPPQQPPGRAPTRPRRRTTIIARDDAAAGKTAGDSPPDRSASC